MHEAFWNRLFDTRWEDAPMGPEATRLVRKLRDCGYAEGNRREYGHPVVHLPGGKKMSYYWAGARETPRASNTCRGFRTIRVCTNLPGL